MDHGPESKKARLSTAGSSWATPSGPSPVNSIPSSSSSHLYQPHPHHQHHQPSYHHAAPAHNHNPNLYSAPAHQQYHPQQPPHQQHQQHQQHHQQQQLHSPSPRLPSPSPRLPSPRHSPHYTLQHQQPPPPPPLQHPSHPSAAGPYQAVHPSASSPSSTAPPPGSHLNGPINSASASAAIDQRPPITSSPAPPTPVPAHSFTHATTLPPPPPPAHNGINTNGRPPQHKPSHSHSHSHSNSYSHSHSHSQPRTYNTHLDDRRQHEQDAYALGPDHRQQDFHSQQQQQQQQQQQPQQPPQPDYRFPSRSPAGAAPSLPPPPHSASPYDRVDKPQHLQSVDDDPTHNRPGSAASATGVRSQQQQPPMLPMRHPEDNGRSMSYDNLGGHPNMGGPGGQPPQPYPPSYSSQQPPQHQQPPPPPPPQMHHTPSQHQHHQPYPQPTPRQPPPPHHGHGHMHPGGQPQQPSPSVPLQGPNSQYRQPSFPPTTAPPSMGHPQQPPPPMSMQQHPHAPPPHQQQPSPTQQPPPLQPHPSQQLQQPPPQQQQQMSQPPPPPPPPQQPPPQLQQHYEQPPPSQQQTPMFNHASVPQPSADILYPLSYGTAGKKKAQRASQACDSCRSLKAKCDETKPCKNCREKNIECKYRDPIPKQQDKVTADIVDSISVLRNDMDTMRNDVMDILRQLLARPVVEAGAQGAAMDLRGSGIASSADAMDLVSGGSNEAGALPAEPPLTSVPDPPPLSSNEAERITRETQGELNAVSDFTGPSVTPTDSAIPSNHTTLAGLLLTWPTIRERVHHLLQEQGIHHLLEYPLRQEEQRGNIRVMGRGEGFDQKMTIRVSEQMASSSQPGTSAAMERGPSNLSNNSSGGSYDDGSDSVRYPGEIWGQLGGWGQTGAYGASSNVELDLDPKTVWKYVKSYEANIQNMHPLINPKPLYAMVTMFLETLPRASMSTSQATRSTWGGPARAPVAAFAGTPDVSQAQSPTAEGSLKRKRSPFPEGYSGPGGTGSTPVAPIMPLRPGMPFRNAESALVLSILALGKICLYQKGRLPDVVPEHLESESPPPTSSQSSLPSPLFANANIHPYNADPNVNNGYSPALSVHDSPAASPAMGLGNTPSRRTSMQGAGSQPMGGSGSSMPWANATGSGAQGGGNSYLPPSSSGAGSAKGGNGGLSGLGSATSMRRNVEDIPGMDYFAAAMEIMSHHRAGRELKHVWILILECLYWGQLGRPVQSLEAVAHAGRLLLAIMRPSMHRYKTILLALQEHSGKTDEFGNLVPCPEEKNVQHRDNPFLLAYWSCLQLESDILAELHLPPSGILTYEKHFPYPRIDLLAKHGIDQRVLESYTAQLYVRNQLNDIHKTLYHGDFNGEPNFKSIEMYSGLLSTHTWVPPRFAFKDTDPPPNEILHARLRAKYWGAQVIVHRFYVRRILELNHEKRVKLEEKRRKREEAGGVDKPEDTDGDIEKEETETVDTRTATEPESQGADAVKTTPPQEIPVGGLPSGPSVQYNDDDSPFSPKSIALARRGIQALVESTRAFHGLPERRFIITNVFGTAHAQWGNLLILDSIQRDPVLGCYISEDLVNDLFRKTIAFFEVVAQPSSSLGSDLRILKGLYNMRMANPVYIEQAKDLPVTQCLPNEATMTYTSDDPQLSMLSANLNQIQELYPFVSDAPAAETIPASSPAPASSQLQSQSQLQSHSQSQYPPRVSPLGPPPPPNANTTAAATQAQPAPGATSHYPGYHDGSPMHMSPVVSSPIQHASPGSLQRHTQNYVSPPAGAFADASGGGSGSMQSPSQARVSGGMQFGPPAAVKTPTTPNESSFPHHLPPYDRRP